MNCEGDAVIDMDIDLSMLVEDMVIFMNAELEDVDMVILIMLVVEVLVPEYAVYATDSLLMDDIALSGMVLSGMVFIDMVLTSATDDVADGVIGTAD